VNGRIIWADVFASKRSAFQILAEAGALLCLGGRGHPGEVHRVTRTRRRLFWRIWKGRRQTIESEPGIYRHSEITGDGFKAFSLTSLFAENWF